MENHAKTINYSLYFDNGYINYESPICMLISVFIWRGFYCLLRLFLQKQSPEFSCRIGSLCHGLISGFMGINQCFLFDSPFDHPEWKTSYIQSFIMAFSFGYFVHDLCWLLQYDRKDHTMICHHILCATALAIFNLKGCSGAQVTCGLGSMEITNPFLQARWFLRSLEMQSMPVYKSTEISFFLVFIFVRIIIGSYFLTIILQQPKNSWEFIIVSLGIYLVSWIFVWGMVKYILRKYIEQASTTGGQK